MQFSKTSPLKSGESSEKSSGENRVKSCHVCGCHGFFGPEKYLFASFRLITVGAEMITELILERAGPVIFKTLLLELKLSDGIQLFFLQDAARRAQPENDWKQ